MRMVTSKAGITAARDTHQGFFPNGGTNQPRCGLVGLKKRENNQYEYIPLGETQQGRDTFNFGEPAQKNGKSFTDRLDKEDYSPNIS